MSKFLRLRLFSSSCLIVWLQVSVQTLLEEDCLGTSPPLERWGPDWEPASEQVTDPATVPSNCLVALTRTLTSAQSARKKTKQSVCPHPCVQQSAPGRHCLATLRTNWAPRWERWERSEQLGSTVERAPWDSERRSPSVSGHMF